MNKKLVHNFLVRGVWASNTQRAKTHGYKDVTLYFTLYNMSEKSNI